MSHVSCKRGLAAAVLLAAPLSATTAAAQPAPSGTTPPGPVPPAQAPPAQAPPPMGAAPTYPATPAPGAPPPYAPPGPPAPMTYEAPAPSPDAVPHDDMPSDEREVLWFVRLEVGVGGPGLLANNGLLTELGFASPKMWNTVDGAWMFRRWVGLGLFAGLNRRASQPADGGPELNAYAGFLGVQAPFMVLGERSYALHLTPRAGFAAGTVDLADDGRASSTKPTGIFGGAVSFQSFTYHVGASLGWLMAPVGSAGDIGPAHDFGGLYAALGGTIDG